MYPTWMVLLLCVSHGVANRHVIRSTQKLREQGFHGDIDLGEVITEAVVDSPEACGRLCKENPACRSAMMMGQLCRMFAPAKRKCFVGLSCPADSSHYKIGRGVTSFQSAMKKCNSMGAHSVHINSKKEYKVIKAFIMREGKELGCKHILTGGKSSVEGSANISNWQWYYNSSFTGQSDPFTFLGWDKNHQGKVHQNYLGLSKRPHYNFTDLMSSPLTHSCYLCECPDSPK